MLHSTIKRLASSPVEHDAKALGQDGESLGGLLAAGSAPMVLRELASHWPACKIKDDEQFAHYLLGFYNGKDLGCFVGDSAIQGRFFYKEDYQALNFENTRRKLGDVLGQILKQNQLSSDEQSSFYIGSATTSAFLEGFETENALPPRSERVITTPIASSWIGNQSRISCHYDTPDNLAVCVHGEREIVLFPPECIEGLYPGPLSMTPAGQVVSVVDFHAPDFERYPKFEEALKRAIVLQLAPGDAVYIPSMWWHHIEALSPLNMLVNYWWHTNPPWIGQSITALHTALLALKDLPAEQRAAWASIFDYYIFTSEHRHQHLPVDARELIGESSPLDARKLRAMINQRLNQ